MATPAFPPALRSAWDSLAAAVVVIDGEGAIHYANRSAERIAADATHINTFAKDAAVRLSSACTGDPVRVETTLDGRTYTMIANRLSAGDVPLAAVLMHDRTRERVFEGVQRNRIDDLESIVEESLADLQWERSDLAQIRRSVEALSYSLGHDLQEPVRAVSACLYLIDPHVPPEQQSLIEEANQATERLARLVAGLLAYSKAARREVRRQSTTTMADVLAAPLCQLQRRRIEARGGSVAVDGEEVPIGATREGLSVVMGEFLMNALQHGAMPPVVRIRVAPEATGARIDVRGNGHGYPSDVLAGFPQRGSATRGFGLAIIQLTVSQLQGTVTVDNDDGPHAVLCFPDRGPRT